MLYRTPARRTWMNSPLFRQSWVHKLSWYSSGLLPIAELCKREGSLTCQRGSTSRTTRQTGLIQRWKDHHQDSHREEVATATSRPQQVRQLLLPNQIWTIHTVQTTHRRQRLTECPRLPQSENRPITNVSLWYCPSDNRTLSPALPSVRWSTGWYMAGRWPGGYWPHLRLCHI